mmetsp:Transcript_15027/g.15768  ORF Transcript_15027/g.15768 Transcript_15027/m.15768 type:complete len:951 (+) Transcript_15027:19-2871(+)
METEIKTEEDRIIELLTLEGENNLYEDTDFIPNRQSLYETEGVIEDYDVDVANFIVWRRPTEIVNFPVYFSDSFGNPSVIQGTLPDETFIGVLMAVASYEDGILMENIIYSRPDDFKQFGVYTCRFYVEGEWVEAITDTRIPCIMDEDQRYLPIYSRSPIRKEMWISLIEKAYAKALGSYHAVTKVKIHEALLHLTGGSVQEIKFNEDIVGDSNKLTSFWSRLKGLLTQHILILAKPADPESKTTSNSNRQGDNPYQNDDNYFVNTHQDGQNPSNGLLDSDETENFDGIISDRLYTVVAYKEVGMNELVLLRCPWQYPDKKVEWEGDWSEASAKWDEYPDMLTSIQNDPKIKWKRSNPKGYLWMSFKDFMKLFHSIHICKLFKQESNHCHYYLAKGEWKDKYCGGPLLSIRDREEGSKHAIREELRGQNKATAAVIIDGDASWFSNPQYKLHSDTTVVVNLSLTPVNIGPDDTLDQGLDGNGLPPSASSHVPNVNIYVVQMHPSLTNSHPCVGDCLSTVLVAQSPKVEKGHEASLWSLKLQGGIDYFVVPTTSKRGQRWGYVLRIFASEPIKLEKVPKWYVTSLTGEWTKTQTIDSTGGPPRLLISSDEMKTTTPAIPSTTANLPQLPSHKSNENPKWCQNPQYHLSITDPTFMQGIHDDIYLKIILKRNDKISGGRHQQNQNNSNPSDMHKEPTVGLVICKPEIQEEVKNHASQIGKPKLNPFGEIMLSKPSSLKKKSKKNQIHPFNDTPNNSNGNSNGKDSGIRSFDKLPSKTYERTTSRPVIDKTPSKTIVDRSNSRSVRIKEEIQRRKSIIKKAESTAEVTSNIPFQNTTPSSSTMTTTPTTPTTAIAPTQLTSSPSNKSNQSSQLDISTESNELFIQSISNTNHTTYSTVSSALHSPISTSSQNGHLRSETPFELITSDDVGMNNDTILSFENILENNVNSDVEK